MSGRKNFGDPETLFSFELLVDYIRIDGESKVSDELALGVRLLDFPTLLVYQPQRGRGGVKQHEKGEHTFNRGKSCLFKMNLSSLQAHLSNTPIYALVLDVKEETPRLVGTSLISLSQVMGRIRRDVAEHGASTPSSHGERGLVGIRSLMGEKIGSISLSYKLMSLGASLLPHITEGSGGKNKDGGRRAQETIVEKNTSTELLPPDCGSVCPPALGKSDVSGNIQVPNENVSTNEDEHDVCVAVQAENKTRSQKVPQMLQETEESLEEDLTMFCPPLLFYSNPEEKSNEGGDCTFPNLDSESFTFEYRPSEEEASENKISSPVMQHQRVSQDVKMSENRETSRLASNVLGDALRQLPLLNALLIELSQLNGQSPQEPLSIHPGLARIYRSASAETSAGHRNTAQKAQTKSSPKTRRGTNPQLKHHLRSYSTPLIRPASVKVRDKQEQSKSSRTSPKKRLVYGSTKTFNLRLKSVSPLKVRRCGCVEFMQNDSQVKADEGKAKSSDKIIKSSKRKSKSDSNQSSSQNENIETMIQNIRVDSTRQETITLKQKKPHGEVHKRDRGSPRSSKKPSLSERDLRSIHIPNVDSGSVAQSKDENEHRSESNPSQSDRHRERMKSSGNNSPKSSFSDCSGGGIEEVDYADDFNSLDPSDACSPDPTSSPEPSRAKTPKSPVRPDSSSEGLHRRAVLPVPIKAPDSPQRTLRGTHIIRPHTHASALSFSSSSSDGNREWSLQTIRSAKQTTDSNGLERSSTGDSFTRGERSASTRKRSPAGGFSAESRSSFEPQESEEVEDELGSLDFRKEYQHISMLVSNKLPGYTM